MDSILRILCAIAGVPMFSFAMMFLLSPETAARQLGMPLLEGIGKSTQIGDFTSFFLSVSILAFCGAWRRSPLLLSIAALLVGGAAVGRVLASALHDATFATELIAVEVTLATLWLVGGLYFRRQKEKRLENS